MEFRNHQVKIGHMLAQFRGNPIALLLLALLIPVALAVVVFVGVVALAGVVVLRLAQGAIAVLTGRPATGLSERRNPFPFAGGERPAGDSTRTASPSGGAIDVEVVKKSEDHST